MKSLHHITILLLTLLLSTVAFAQQKGDVILSTRFDRHRSLKGWNGRENARIKKLDGRKVMRIRNRDAGTAVVEYQLPASRLRGCKIAVRTWLSAKDISAPPKSYNGVKVMLHTHTTAGINEYPQLPLKSGTFSNKEGYSVYVPADADTAALVLGLEEVSGTLWVDSINVSVIAPPRSVPFLKPAGKIYTGHQSDRLRGAMIPTSISAEDLRALAAWGANLVRWQINSEDLEGMNVQEYSKWLNTSLMYIDSLLPLCRSLGLKILIDLHTMPGGHDNIGPKLFSEKEWQDAFITIWKQIATRYNNENTIWGYDLANEPADGVLNDSLLAWPQLATLAANSIRAIDTNHAIIVESAPGAEPGALSLMEPISVPGIVYSIHVYEPFVFTGQGIEDTSEHISYPGIIQGNMWNKEMLRRALAPVVQWQHDYNVQIFVGEFSAIRWAPGESAYNYIRDCIDIFEENGWDWTYHAFRESQVWNVELDNNRNHLTAADTPTLRQQLLMSWFQKNQH